MEIPAKFFDVSFNKAMAFGYKTEDVDEFVTKALQYIRELQEENETLNEKMHVLAENLSKYREEEDSLRSALIGAQKLGDSILRDCRSKAEAIIRDATARADKVTQDAALELERQRYELERVEAETTEFKDKLFALYRAHLDLINNIPSSREVAERHRNTTPPPPRQPKQTPVQQQSEHEPPQEDGFEDEYADTAENNAAEQENLSDERYDDEPARDSLSEEEYVDDSKEPDESAQDDEPQQMYGDFLQPSENDFPNEQLNDEQYDEEQSFEKDAEEQTYEQGTEEDHEPEQQPVTMAVAADSDDAEEQDDTYVYVPRVSSQPPRSAFEPVPMVQMEFFEDQDGDDDEFSEDTRNLRSVDLDRIPYFDDEDEEDEDFSPQQGRSKHRVSKKFGELKFGDSFDLTKD